MTDDKFLSSADVVCVTYGLDVDVRFCSPSVIATIRPQPLSINRRLRADIRPTVTHFFTKQLRETLTSDGGYRLEQHHAMSRGARP